jgi:tRNA (cytidine/uridine-2'-O-)-methyltransferase
MRDLGAHRIELALVHPQIAANTGNVARLCVATGTRLHLVRPMGFVLSDRHLRRSAMDYWPRLALTVHDDFPGFDLATGSRRRWWFDSDGALSLWEADLADGDLLVFGSETRGIDPEVLARERARTVRIPQRPGERCLNLSTACGVALYAGLARVTRRRASAVAERRTGSDNPDRPER